MRSALGLFRGPRTCAESSSFSFVFFWGRGQSLRGGSRDVGRRWLQTSTAPCSNEAFDKLLVVSGLCFLTYNLEIRAFVLSGEGAVTSVSMYSVCGARVPLLGSCNPSEEAKSPANAEAIEIGKSESRK